MKQTKQKKAPKLKIPNRLCVQAHHVCVRVYNLPLNPCELFQPNNTNKNERKK
jgi:hypothetical protein